MIDKATGDVVFKDFRAGPSLQRHAFVSSSAGRAAKVLERDGRTHAYVLDVHERRGRRFELLLTFVGQRLRSYSLTVGEEEFHDVPDLLSAYVSFDCTWLWRRCGIPGDGGVFPWGRVERWLDYKNGYHGVNVRYKSARAPAPKSPSTPAKKRRALR